jgi:probable HAF family extracellular repeat protein
VRGEFKNKYGFGSKWADNYLKDSIEKSFGEKSMRKHILKYRLVSSFFVPAVMLPYVASGVALATPQYTLAELGNFGGAVTAEGLNNQGQVVGSASLPDGNYHAFVWAQSTGMMDLGTLSGNPDSQASAINDAGQVTGTSTDGGSTTLPFLWQAGTGMMNIGGAAGILAQPTGINAQGQVVGVASVNTSSNFGFVYAQSSGLNAVRISGVPVYDVHAINAEGQMTVDAPGSSNDLFLSPGKAPVEISGQNLTGSVALAMNDQGLVVGYAQAGSMDTNHAYVWSQSSGLTDLTPNLQGIVFASAQSINNEDQIVGYESFESEPGVAFLYENGTLYDLSTLLGASADGWSDLRAEAINDNGQIAGYGFFDGQEESFLLTPTAASEAFTSAPEPGTLAVLAVAGVMVGMRRRRGPG